MERRPASFVARIVESEGTGAQELTHDLEPTLGVARPLEGHAERGGVGMRAVGKDRLYLADP